MNISLGHDPELIVVDAGQDRPISALKLLGQDKYDPIDLGSGIKFYGDNVLCEFSSPPCDSPEAATIQMKGCLERIQEHLGSKYRLRAQAAHTYDPEELVVVPAKNRRDEKGEPIKLDPWEVGCLESEDVYTGRVRKQFPFKDGMRTGSFHIHIGDRDIVSNPKSKLKGSKNKAIAVRIMDMVVGCAGVVLDKDPTSKDRKAIYGGAGEHRKTPYGIEYRVLGNYFLRSPELTRLVFDLTAYAMGIIDSGDANDFIQDIPETTVRNAINRSNVCLAKSVLMKINPGEDLWNRINQDYEPELYRDWGI